LISRMTNELNERKITEALAAVQMPGSDRSIIERGFGNFSLVQLRPPFIFA